MRQARYTYWQHITSKMNRFTSISQLWSTVKQLNGLSTNNNKKIPTLNVEGNSVDSNEDKADAFANYFKSVGDADDNTTRSLIIQTELETYLQDNNTFNHLTINEPFSMAELNKALNTEKKSAPGLDGLSYSIYKNLPESARQILLKL